MLNPCWLWPPHCCITCPAGLIKFLKKRSVNLWGRVWDTMCAVRLYDNFFSAEFRDILSSYFPAYIPHTCTALLGWRLCRHCPAEPPPSLQNASSSSRIAGVSGDVTDAGFSFFSACPSQLGSLNPAPTDILAVDGLCFHASAAFVIRSILFSCIASSSSAIGRSGAHIIHPYSQSPAG